MERIKAFGIALALFLLTASGFHFYAESHVKLPEGAYGCWTKEVKSQSYSGITQNLDGQTLLVFGSSEFQHGTDTKYHPSRLFRETALHPMLIGAGYYQSLSHAVTLAAVSDRLEVKKAVLILSPQWFRKTGVLPQAYASRFSELLYEEMLKNPALSEETAAYLSERTHHLLEGDATVLARVQRAENSACGEEDSLENVFWRWFLEEKDRFSICLKAGAARLEGNEGTVLRTPDFAGLLEEAVQDGQRENTNAFYISDQSYARLAPHLKEKEGMNADAYGGYQGGPEFDDLKCFLRVCRENGVKPLLVIVPVNGYYYDFTQFPSSARQAYYKKIRKIAQEAGVETADFSDQEYTKYFFEDRVHLGKVGWVMVNRSIWDWYQGE